MKDEILNILNRWYPGESHAMATKQLSELFQSKIPEKYTDFEASLCDHPKFIEGYNISIDQIKEALR